MGYTNPARWRSENRPLTYEVSFDSPSHSGEKTAKETDEDDYDLEALRNQTLKRLKAQVIHRRRRDLTKGEFRSFPFTLHVDGDISIHTTMQLFAEVSPVDSRMGILHPLFDIYIYIGILADILDHTTHLDTIYNFTHDLWVMPYAFLRLYAQSLGINTSTWLSFDKIDSSLGKELDTFVNDTNHAILQAEHLVYIKDDRVTQSNQEKWATRHRLDFCKMAAHWLRSKNFIPYRGWKRATRRMRWFLWSPEVSGDPNDTNPFRTKKSIMRDTWRASTPRGRGTDPKNPSRAKARMNKRSLGLVQALLEIVPPKEIQELQEEDNSVQTEQPNEPKKAFNGPSEELLEIIDTLPIHRTWEQNYTLSRYLHISNRKIKFDHVESDLRRSEVRNVTRDNYREAAADLDLLEPAYEVGPILLDEEMLTLERKRRDTYEYTNNVRTAPTRVRRDQGTVTDSLKLTAKIISDIKADVGSYFLTGYDCAHPQGITPVSSLLRHECKPPEVEDLSVVRSIQYQLLQKANTRRISGYKCSKRVSQQTFYCGNADHSTPLPHETYFNRKIRISAADCDEMYKTKMYKPESKGTRAIPAKPLQVPGETVVGYYTAGRAYGWVDWTGTQVSCRGDRIAVGDDDIYSMVQYMEETIILEEETIVQRHDESLIAFYDNRRLRAALEDGSSIAGLTTYIWKIPKEDHCPFYHVKTFTGNVISANNSRDEVIASSDGQSIRLIKRGAEQHCGRKVLSTNYPDIYLYPVIDINGNSQRDLFQRKLPPGEARLDLYISNRDDTLYHRLHSEITKEYQAVWVDECFRRYKGAKLEHFLAREFPGYYTYSLGGNNFLSTSGECTFKYTCKPMLVRALEKKHCYDALPVVAYDQLNSSMGVEVTQFKQLNGDSEYYLEPLTHRLTKVAARIPCTQSFYARYKDVLDRWFAVTPSMEAVDSPSDIVITPSNRYDNEYGESDFGPGKGIYTTEQIHGIQEHLEFSRVKDALTQKLADQVTDLTPDGAVDPSQLFPSRVLYGGSWQTFILGRLLGYLHSLGEIASTLIGLYIIMRVIWELFKMMANVYQLYRANGCSITLFMVLCIDLFHSHNYMKAKTKEREELRARSPTVEQPKPSWRDRMSDMFPSNRGTTNNTPSKRKLLGETEFGRLNNELDTMKREAASAPMAEQEDQPPKYARDSTSSSTPNIAGGHVLDKVDPDINSLRRPRGNDGSAAPPAER